VFLHVPETLSRRENESERANSNGNSNKNENSGSTKREPALSLVFFVTGNPGLISYYHTFLSLIVARITAESERTTGPVVVAGFSLAGFEVGVTPDGGRGEGYEDEILGLLYPSAGDGHHHKGMYGLKEQLDLTLQRIEGLVRRLREDYDGVVEGQRPTKVILVGHSLGTYISLELVRLWHERYGALSPAETEWEVSAAILLTPTIIDLAKSPSGRLAAPVLGNLPFVPDLGQTLARGLSALPSSWLEVLVQRITGMQGPALQTTMSFLRRPRIVKQALYLARDELQEIDKDKWGPEVWDDGVEVGPVRTVPSPALYLWFAKKDHWVADVTREEICNRRGGITDGQKEWKDHPLLDYGKRRPTIRVDENEGLVHAWCIGQSDLVAGRVFAWLQEIWTRNGLL